MSGPDRNAEAVNGCVLGIDPGAHGAIALLDEAGHLLEVFDMPVTREANGRHATSAPLLAGILARSHARVAFCEFVGARPTDAKVAAFAFGRAKGVIEGCCGALSIPITFLTPPTWKRLADIPPGSENKDVARTRAIGRWPASADFFARKCDVDRAEAALIGWAGLVRETHHLNSPISRPSGGSDDRDNEPMRMGASATQRPVKGQIDHE